jgi:hypothetical protein
MTKGKSKSGLIDVKELLAQVRILSAPQSTRWFRRRSRQR